MPRGIEFSVRLGGVDRLMERFEPRQLVRRTTGALRESLGLLRGLVVRAMPRDQGLAAASVFTSDNAPSLLTELRGRVASPLVHVRVLEEGRRAGGPMPPRAALVSWLLRHGMPETAYWPVAAAIAVRGLPAHRMFAGAARAGAAPVLRIWRRWLDL